MKTNVLFLLLCIGFAIACGDDEESGCSGESCGDVTENIIGSWSDGFGNVTFNSDGTGLASDMSFFVQEYDSIEYKTFTWNPCTEDNCVEVNWNFTQSMGPIFAVGIDYTAEENFCNCIILTDVFTNRVTLKRQ